jgi:branched-chain amino acid aminotransferase
MIGEFCSLDGQLVPVEQATIAADDIHFAYGYGVYETLKVRKGVLHFPDLHIERLLRSARIIGLKHNWQAAELDRLLQDLIRANTQESSNIKMMLLGGPSPEKTRLYIMELAPFFPSRKSYATGIRAVLYSGERHYPGAKSLSMLLSTMAFRKASEHGAYDAVLVNREGHCTEGTRTNLFYTDGEELFTPPEHQVLSGVTRYTVIQAAREAGIRVSEQPLPVAELVSQEGLFLTSTSSKVIPVSRVEDYGYGLSSTDPTTPAPGPLQAIEFDIPEIIRETARVYDTYLERYRLEREQRQERQHTAGYHAPQ